MKTLISFLICITGLTVISSKPKHIEQYDERSLSTYNILEEKRKADRVTSEAKALISEIEFLLSEKEYKEYFQKQPFRKAD